MRDVAAKLEIRDAQHMTEGEALQIVQWLQEQSEKLLADRPDYRKDYVAKIYQ